MKKLLFLYLAAGYWLTVAAGDPVTSWVDSKEGKCIVKKITIGDKKAKLVMINGAKKVLTIDQISAYSVNGKVFKKLPLFADGKCTGKMVFMELIKNEGELVLYRYQSWCYPNIKITNYLLFKGDTLCMEFDEK